MTRHSHNYMTVIFTFWRKLYIKKLHIELRQQIFCFLTIGYDLSFSLFLACFYSKPYESLAGKR
jgi:hypothetical protein